MRRAAGFCVLALVGMFAVVGVLAPAPAAAQSQPPPLRIVVMGDSYTAGNGAGGYAGPTDCFRSPAAWGERYRSWLEAAGQPPR
jgi:hypothetical protein